MQIQRKTLQPLLFSLALVGLTAISGCEFDKYSACVATYERDQSRWCVEDTVEECDGIDEDDGWKATYHRGQSCESRGFPVDCHDGAWEDHASDC